MLIDGVGLLERAVGYALGSVTAVTPGLLSRPTPCAEWDLRMLLCHLNDSLAALLQGVGTGRISPDPVADDASDLAVDLVATFRDHACRLLGAWTAAGDRGRIIAIIDPLPQPGRPPGGADGTSLAGRPLLASVVAGTGAIEIAVHGWDISRACGQRRLIPPALAVDLLSLCPLLVTEATRHPSFAVPVAAPSPASPSDRLVAFLGRSPTA